MCFFKWKHGGKLKKFSFSIIKGFKKKNSDRIHCALVCNLHQSPEEVDPLSIATSHEIQTLSSVRLPGNKLIALKTVCPK